MRTILVSLLLCGAVSGQELERAELDEFSKHAKEAKLQSLSAELKTAQAAIKARGKGFQGQSVQDRIVAARKREAAIQKQLDALKKTGDVLPELDIEKLAVGQIGKLYRLVGSRNSFTVSDSRGPQRVTTTTYSRVPVEVEVVRIIAAGNVLVAYKDKLLAVRMATAGIVTDQKLILDRAIKVMGTKIIDGRTVLELGVYEG